MMQVTKVWWDGEKLMAEPIDPFSIYKKNEQPAQQHITCNKTLVAQGKAYPRTCKKCGLGPCIADLVQPAQQEQNLNCKSVQARLAAAWGYVKAQRTWAGLTDKEAMQICVDCGCLSEDWLVLLDAIEAKLKEKNDQH